MKYDLFDKSVLLTGVTGGIGKELAILLITKYNCKVYGVGRNRIKAEQLKTELGDKADQFIPVFADLCNDECYSILDNLPTIDILINNAGVMPPFMHTEKVTKQDCEQVLKSNFYAPVRLINTVLHKLKTSENGAIINIASSVALCPITGTSAYGASKAALKNYTETLCLDSDLYVSTVYAGFTKTDLFTDLDFSNDKLLGKISSTPQKTAKRIITGMRKRKKRIITGLDAKAMNLLYKLFPVKGPRLIKRILKKSGRSAFSEL